MNHPAELASTVPSRAVLAGRIGTGLGQGLALYALSRLVEDKVPHPWVSANPIGFGLLVLLATLLPWPVLLGLGHVRIRVLAAWTAAAAGLICLLGGYDLRQNGALSMAPASNGLLASLGAILFLGQALVAAADAGRRVWPHYADCFEAAWRAALQLALAGCFVLGFWLIYWVGAQLFKGIGMEALDMLGGSPGFVLPVSAVAAAAGIHLADAGWRLTLGLRSLLLGLKAWLTPVLAGLVGAFILALPFTELQSVWWRGAGPGWLLAAAAGLVTLVSAVHGDGRHPAALPGLLPLSARLATPMLPLLLILAGWALFRQVNAQGITQERVLGFAAMAVLFVHAVCYPLAALRPMMKLLEPANMIAAIATVAVLAALNTPLADPARLEVESQTARLRRGAVPPDDFNFGHLARMGRDGRQALAALTADPDPEIARRARAATLTSYDDARATAAATVVPRLRALPDGTAVPPGLVTAMREALPDCGTKDCLARAFPAAGDGAWLVGPVGGSFWAMRPGGTGWQRLAIYEPSYTCWDRTRAGMLAGEARSAAPSLPDLVLAGVLLRPVVPAEECR